MVYALLTSKSFASRLLPVAAFLIFTTAARASDPPVVPTPLPDAPSATLVSTSAQPLDLDPTSNPQPKPSSAPHGFIVQPWQTAPPLTAGGKIATAFHERATIGALGSVFFAAGYEQITNGKPHFGTDRGAFGERLGAAAIRQSADSILNHGVFSAIFHDDPRYYVLGSKHSVAHRAVYAASRIVLIRTDSGHNTINLPGILSHAAVAAIDSTYYPARDTVFKSEVSAYFYGFGTTALNYELDEFLDDALRTIHLRKKR